MTTALVAIRPGALALGRVAALLALASAAVHLLLLDTSSLASLAMVGMAAVCLPCGWHLWHDPSGSVWRLTMLVDAAMLVLHAQMLSASGHVAGMHHHPGGAGALMWLGLALVGTQLLLAALGAALRR